MTAAQWECIATRTPTYLEGYRDTPGVGSRAQLRSWWLAGHGAFSEAKSVLELGCGCGRNLAELRRKYQDMEVSGVDINHEALEECGRILPSGRFENVDLYHLYRAPDLRADVIFTVGVLGHLEATGASALITWMRYRAKQAVVLVEEPGYDTIAKGPKSWGASKSTGDYVLWRHNFDRMTGPYFRSIETLPAHLRAPAATHLFVIRPSMGAQIGRPDL
jgi:SAM-dependent methyltransferase